MERPSSEQLAAQVEERAVRLAALLRELNNRPRELEDIARAQLDDALRMLHARVLATRALLRPPPRDEPPAG